MKRLCLIAVDDFKALNMAEQSGIFDKIVEIPDGADVQTEVTGYNLQKYEEYRKYTIWTYIFSGKFLSVNWIKVANEHILKDGVDRVVPNVKGFSVFRFNYRNDKTSMVLPIEEFV